jgi:hypothetical protein
MDIVASRHLTKGFLLFFGRLDDLTRMQSAQGEILSVATPPFANLIWKDFSLVGKTIDKRPL